jgi:hypothetical protein
VLPLYNNAIKQFFSNKGGFNDVNTFYHVKYMYLQAENRVLGHSVKSQQFLECQKFEKWKIPQKEAVHS